MHHLEKAPKPSGPDSPFRSDFARDVFLGLSQQPKWLSSKYFYDDEGDKIFRRIMHMDSYYLTRAELQLFELHKESMLKLMGPDASLRIIELGAGDGLKTSVLLKHFVNRNVNFEFVPIDISEHALEVLEESLLADIPELEIHSLQGDYFNMLSRIKGTNTHRNVVFFLGSNIGNFSDSNAIDFLSKISSNLNAGDLLMLGFDLKKDPALILAAYDDPEGISAEFNYNLLRRINRELGGNFLVDQFIHHPMYNPVTGECSSFLVSREDQDVFIEELDDSFHFEKWEPVFTEVSRKYAIQEMKEIVEEAGFRAVGEFMDEKGYFMDLILKVEE